MNFKSLHCVIFHRDLNKLKPLIDYYTNNCVQI